MRTAPFAPTGAAALAIEEEGKKHEQDMPVTPTQNATGSLTPVSAKIRFTPDTRMTPTRTDVDST